MDLWTALITLAVPATGGGLWVTVRQWMAWRERREKAQREHETALLSRCEEMQQKYLDSIRESERMFLGALQALQDEARQERETDSDRLERLRERHLADVRLATDRIAEAMQTVQAVIARVSSRAPSPTPTTFPRTSEPR